MMRNFYRIQRIVLVVELEDALHSRLSEVRQAFLEWDCKFIELIIEAVRLRRFECYDFIGNNPTDISMAPLC